MKNCDLDFKLEEVLPKFPQGLQAKIMHSVELIRKAEPLALAYDPEDGFFNTFSGGKDSQCLYHIVKMAGVKHKTHMNLTSVDPPEVIRFVKTEYPDVVLAKPKDSIFHLAVKKGALPTMRVRWCCAEYKETAGAGKVTLIGIRHAESNRRALRKEVEVSNHGYSGDLEGLSEYRKQRNSGRKPRKGTFSIINVNGESEVGCIHGKESLLISPIIDWTEDEVWTFLNTLGIKHNPLYDQGFHRIGCICCPLNSNKVQKEREAERWPHVKRGWIKAIKEIRRGGQFCKGAYKDNIWWGIPREFIPLRRVQRMDSRGGVSKVLHNGSDDENDKTLLQTKFSDSVLSDGLTEAQEDEIAENIFDWWISGKAYKKWYAEKFLQQDLFETTKKKN